MSVVEDGEGDEDGEVGPVTAGRIQIPAGVHLLLAGRGGHRNQRVPRMRDLPPQSAGVTPFRGLDEWRLRRARR